MTKYRFIFCMAAFLLTGFIPPASAVGEIQIEDTQVKENPPDKYEVSALIRNASFETREITLRFQLFFFDENAPKGDLPAMILRKDETVVMNSGTEQKISVTLINEGSLPKGRLRLSPEVRTRRNRIWNY